MITDRLKVYIGVWTFIVFATGYNMGSDAICESAEKEIIELSIELTKLEIKKLRGGDG